MKFTTTILMLFAVVAVASAQEPTLPTPDAKTLGMGGVAMTSTSGSHAIYSNAATTLFSSLPSQISSSYYGQSDFDYYSISGYYRINNKHVVQLGWRQYLRGEGNNDKALDVGYSRRLTDRWAIGITARYMSLKRPGAEAGESVTADALAVDLSTAYMLPIENIGQYSMLRIGAKLGNLGGYLSDTEYSLPMDLTAGAALDTYITDAHEVTVGADVSYYFSPSQVRGFQFAVGAEYNLMQLVQLRAGYHFGERDSYYPSYTSLGAGVRFLHLRLDFAYLFAACNTLLHNTYSISFGLDF